MSNFKKLLERLLAERGKASGEEICCPTCGSDVCTKNKKGVCKCRECDTVWND